MKFWIAICLWFKNFRIFQFLFVLVFDDFVLVLCSWSLIFPLKLISCCQFSFDLAILNCPMISLSLFSPCVIITHSWAFSLISFLAISSEAVSYWRWFVNSRGCGSCERQAQRDKHKREGEGQWRWCGHGAELWWRWLLGLFGRQLACKESAQVIHRAIRLEIGESFSCWNLRVFRSNPKYGHHLANTIQDLRSIAAKKFLETKLCRSVSIVS